VGHIQSEKATLAVPGSSMIGVLVGWKSSSIFWYWSTKDFAIAGALSFFAIGVRDDLGD